MVHAAIGLHAGRHRCHTRAPRLSCTDTLDHKGLLQGLGSTRRQVLTDFDAQLER